MSTILSSFQLRCVEFIGFDISVSSGDNLWGCWSEAYNDIVTDIAEKCCPETWQPIRAMIWISQGKLEGEFRILSLRDWYALTVSLKELFLFISCLWVCSCLFLFTCIQKLTCACQFYLSDCSGFWWVYSLAQILFLQTQIILCSLISCQELQCWKIGRKLKLWCERGKKMLCEWRPAS